MYSFRMILEEQDKSGALTDRFLEKLFERVQVPRIGETVLVGGNGHEVTGVDHGLDRNNDNDRALIVRAAISEFDFRTLREADTTWSFREGYGS